MAESITITGLKEFQTSLRQMDSELPKQIRIALNGVSQLLVDKVRPEIPNRSGAARASLTARSSQREARIAVGGRKAPYYPWLDFGGKTGINRSVDRPFFREGRYIYPTLRKNRDHITALMVTALSDLATSAGLEVT